MDKGKINLLDFRNFIQDKVDEYCDGKIVGNDDQIMALLRVAADIVLNSGGELDDFYTFVDQTVENVEEVINNSSFIN
jgi:hypothetical protein